MKKAVNVEVVGVEKAAGGEGRPQISQIAQIEKGAGVARVARGGAEAQRVELDGKVVTAQYRRALAGSLEMVRFGAMLMWVESNLTREIGSTRGGGWTPSEETLKGWLEKHCPDVNYQTAMRFKGLAEGVQRACDVPNRVPMMLALPGSGGETDTAFLREEGVALPVGQKMAEKDIREIRARVWDLVEGKSARQLQFAFMSDRTAPGGAHHVGHMTNEEKFEKRRQDARKMWNAMVAEMVDKHVGMMQTHLLLDQETIRVLLARLEVVRDALKEAGKLGSGE